MDNIQNMIQELEQEGATTKRLLDVVPAGKLEWRPHNKSMSLGQLAMHVASIPGGVARLLTGDSFDATKANFHPPQPESKEAILEAFEAAISSAKQELGTWDSKKAVAPWTLTKGEQPVFTLPRAGVARTIMLNHWYHHRGQLTVYLRLLDVPLPVTYGRSADTNPFA
jgi:uncharacterized damage-inducible protein DinB